MRRIVAGFVFLAALVQSSSSTFLQDRGRGGRSAPRNATAGVESSDGRAACSGVALKEAMASARAGRLSLSEAGPCFHLARLGSKEAGDLRPADVEALRAHGGHHVPTPPLTRCLKVLPPSLLYIGLPHAGSTRLARQLNLHPELSFGLMKEHRFFCHVSASPTPSWRAYLKEFVVDCGVKRSFDATPSYLYLGDPEARPQIEYPFHAPGVEAVRLVREWLGPELKLVAMIRDPVEWLASFDEQPPACYADALEGWLAVIPRENFLFLHSDDYFAKPQATLDRVFNFVGVSPRRYRLLELAPAGRRRVAKRPIVSGEARRSFHADPANRECRRKLEALTGLKFGWEGLVEE